MQLISGTVQPTQLPWLPVLANIAPLEPRRMLFWTRYRCTQSGQSTVTSLTIHLDFQFGPSLYRPTLLRHGVILGSQLQWSISLLVTDPTIQQLGFDLSSGTWCALNHFRTGQDRCATSLHKQGLVSSWRVNVEWHRQCHILWMSAFWLCSLIVVCKEFILPLIECWCI